MKKKWYKKTYRKFCFFYWKVENWKGVATDSVFAFPVRNITGKVTGKNWKLER